MFGKLGLGLGLGAHRKNPIDVATDAYISGIVAAGGSAPDATRKAIIRTLVASLINDSLWDKLSALYIAGHDMTSSMVNLVNPSIVASRVNDLPTANYTVDSGWVGAADKAIDLNINLSTDSNYKDGLGMLGVFLTSEVTTSYAIPIGSRSTTPNIDNNHITKAESIMRAIQYVDGATTGAITTIAPNGFFTATTTSEKRVILSCDGFQIAEYTDSANIDKGNIYDGNCFGLAVNNGGSPAIAMEDGICSAFVIGGNMSAAAAPAESDISRLYNALNTYLIAIGAKAV